MQVAGSTVIVFGGSSGLGAASARLLCERGASVVVADVRPAVESHVEFVEADVADEASVQNALNAAVNRLGTLRAAIVCAGIIHVERIVGRDNPHNLDAFRRVIDVNLVGTFNVLRLAAEAMQRNEPDADGERGVIVMTSSIAAMEGQIGQAAYAASKGGVAALTLPAARELGQIGIRVVSIAPGVFETPMMEQVSETYRESLQSQSAFPRRFGQPAEFAALVAHVLENSMLNGTVIRLDGGMRMAAR
jgi:NAD(P)-dependent dehydrogenase (short-subunit alcohol dehydrogenase family)